MEVPLVHLFLGGSRPERFPEEVPRRLADEAPQGVVRRFPEEAPRRPPEDGDNCRLLLKTNESVREW